MMEHIHEKALTSMCQKRPTSVKRDLLECQKRPTNDGAHTSPEVIESAASGKEQHVSNTLATPDTHESAASGKEGFYKEITTHQADLNEAPFFFSASGKEGFYKEMPTYQADLNEALLVTSGDIYVFHVSVRTTQQQHIRNRLATH